MLKMFYDFNDIFYIILSSETVEISNLDSLRFFKNAYCPKTLSYRFRRQINEKYIIKVMKYLIFKNRNFKLNLADSKFTSAIWSP